MNLCPSEVNPQEVNYEGYTLDLALRSVGEGWAPLLHEVFDAIKDTFPPVKILLVKERWGILRIYTNIINEEVDKVVIDIAKRSRYICEVCGASGSLRSGEHIMALCDAHAEGRDTINEED